MNMDCVLFSLKLYGRNNKRGHQQWDVSDDSFDFIRHCLRWHANSSMHFLFKSHISFKETLSEQCQSVFCKFQ